ncbi:citryl-CoA lyase [Marinobacter sp. F4206]|uniref:citryl-CoA lyase n=1 Tax=Marinobacter sp. F4206 TaxID=2861777 RepID=UPI001C605C11|nr:citryl-CoA lyase [Marinobacter sp. F4206]MBW4934809.1 citryl-CoA lyase [Marinobacter sp. F4206]
MATEYQYHSNIWFEEPELENPFAAKACYCSGYDVYGEVVQKAGWFEYLLLMFKGERPGANEAQLLEKLAMVLANPGPREASVRAAMNAGVAGTNHSSALMAALAVGAGQYGGSQEVSVCIELWRECRFDFDAWCAKLLNPSDDERADIWLPMEHAPGFDPNGDVTPTPILQSLELLAGLAPANGALAWLKANRQALEQHVGYPLAMSGLASAALIDLGMDADQGSMLYLMLRLPGAATHAVEQKHMGWKKFPYYGPAIELDESASEAGRDQEATPK